MGLSEEPICVMPHSIGAVMVRIGFSGPLYYDYSKEARKPYSNYLGPYVSRQALGAECRVRGPLRKQHHLESLLPAPLYW